MKKYLFAVILACCSLSMAAQDGSIQVSYKGAKPTITDFITAYLAPSPDEEECDGEAVNHIRNAWNRYLKGLKQEEGVTLNVDVKNGFAVYETRSNYDGNEHLVRIEMCYWNFDDQKHKLFAYNYMCFENDKYSAGQYDGLTLCKYDNAKKSMFYTSDAGVDAAIEASAEGVWTTFALPRSGKDLTITRWLPSGMTSSETLKWNGHGFNYK